MPCVSRICLMLTMILINFTAILVCFHEWCYEFYIVRTEHETRSNGVYRYVVKHEHLTLLFNLVSQLFHNICVVLLSFYQVSSRSGHLTWRLQYVDTVPNCNYRIRGVYFLELSTGLCEIPVPGEGSIKYYAMHYNMVSRHEIWMLVRKIQL